MKFYTKTLILFLLLPSFLKNELRSQSKKPDKIYLTIKNIPKIKHKVYTSKNSYTIDKSPTITYRVFNDAKAYEIKQNSNNLVLTKQFENDTIYLKLRYNPGKSQMFILRKGDSANIDYIFGKPYLEIKNRDFKKHDVDILSAINEFNLKDRIFRFPTAFNKADKEKEKKEAIKSYNKILNSLDSLFKKDLVSNAEYYYYKKYFTYKKGVKLNDYNLKLLKKSDLHVEGYEFYLRQYAFSNLKKKIISLGNGMARNSLEGFDFVFDSNDFSIQNKNHLLLRYLKNIQLDFSKSIFNDRKLKYETLISKKENSLIFKSDTTFLKSVDKLTNTVQLVDSKNNITTLKKIIQENPGKVIYIDFWASWCAPCRRAFPSYISLKKEYSKEKVLFLFISGDQDSNKWKLAAQEEKLSNSYLAINYKDSKFYKELKLTIFPRYLIFDKKGQLSIKKAPGPDSDNVRGFIDETLLE